VLSGKSWLESKQIEGGTASARLAEQIKSAREALRRVDAILSERRS
jgi:hypothetical protein